MTPEEKMNQDAISNAKMVKLTYDALAEEFPEHYQSTLIKMANELVAASLRWGGSYSL